MRAAAYNTERLPVPQATNHPGDDHSDQLNISDSDRDDEAKNSGQRAVYKALKGSNALFRSPTTPSTFWAACHWSHDLKLFTNLPLPLLRGTRVVQSRFGTVCVQHWFAFLE